MDTTPINKFPFAEDDDLIRNFPNQVSRVLAERVDSAINDAQWQHGWIIAGDDLDNYSDMAQSGVYSISTASVANLPVNRVGILEVLPTATTVVQRYTAWVGQRIPEVYLRTFVNGVASVWMPTFGIATRDIGTGSLDDYNEISQAGFYRVTSSQVGSLPIHALGILELIPMSRSNIQRYTSWSSSASPRMFVRSFKSDGTPTGWTDLTAGGSSVTIEQGARTSNGVISQDKALATFRAHLSRHSLAPVPIVFAGSSTTAGNGATSIANRYVNRVISNLQNRYPSGGEESTVEARQDAAFTPITTPGVHGYNIGRGGTDASDYLTDADDTGLAALSPALIVHMVGSNDFARRRSLTTYKAEIEHRINHLSSLIATPHVHVLVQQYKRQDVTDPSPEWSAYGEVLRGISESNSETVAYIDVSEAFDVADLSDGDPFGFLGPDNVHSTDAGHKFLAECLAIGLDIK